MVDSQDKCVQARVLIEKGHIDLLNKLQSRVDEIQVAIEQAQESLEGLAKLGSANIEAPIVLSGAIRGKLQNLATYSQNCVKHIDHLNI